MCVATAAITTLIGTALSVGNMIAQNKAEEKTNEYKQQIAINQVKSAQEEAQRQKQLGIEKSREEKIKGLKEISKLQAQSASSGFDMNSQTNLFNYDDVETSYDNSANNILDSYYNNAKAYSDKADQYRTQIKIDNVETDLKNKQEFMNALGKTTKVALNWYDGLNSTPAVKGGANGSF